MMGKEIYVVTTFSNNAVRMWLSCTLLAATDTVLRSLIYGTVCISCHVFFSLQAYSPLARMTAETGQGCCTRASKYLNV